MSLKKKVGMIKSYATSIVSRGLTNKKTDKFTKQLRVLSCFGNEHSGGELPPCEHLERSKVKHDKFYCGGCGCGDRKATWLLADGEEYSKLDYPKVACPLKMPGFSTYIESDEDSSDDIPTRKSYIENMSDDDIKLISVSILEMPDDVKERLSKKEEKTPITKKEVEDKD
jgi:hypothetical protein|tara:strand:- start:102 stop:611 length:510 start_codon:yes stop_codon:yes gene_type:complete